MVVRAEGGPRSCDPAAAAMRVRLTWGTAGVLKPLRGCGGEGEGGCGGCDGADGIERGGCRGRGGLGDRVKVRVLGDGDERYVDGDGEERGVGGDGAVMTGLGGREMAMWNRERRMSAGRFAAIGGGGAAVDAGGDAGGAEQQYEPGECDKEQGEAGMR